MREYVLTVSTRDPEHPLLAETLIEFGVDAQRPLQFVGAVDGLAGMLRELKTPEKAAEYIRNHAAISSAVTLHKQRIKP